MIWQNKLGCLPWINLMTTMKLNKLEHFVFHQISEGALMIQENKLGCCPSIKSHKSFLVNAQTE
jgi:hypothetical protein